MRRRLGWMAIWLLLLLGCQPGAERGPQGAAGPAASAETSGAAEGDTEYFACYLQGDKTGYIESTTRRVRQDERDLVETTTNQRLAARRFGNEVQIDIATTSLETLAGEVLRCSATTTIGGNTDTIEARREGDQLILETTVAGTRSSSRMACARRARFSRHRSLAPPRPAPGRPVPKCEGLAADAEHDRDLRSSIDRRPARNGAAARPQRRAAAHRRPHDDSGAAPSGRRIVAVGRRRRPRSQDHGHGRAGHRGNQLPHDARGGARRRG